MAKYFCTVDETLDVWNGGVVLTLPRSFTLIGKTPIELRTPDGRATRTKMDGIISFFTGDIGFSVRTNEDVPAGTEVWIVESDGRGE